MRRISFSLSNHLLQQRLLTILLSMVLATAVFFTAHIQSADAQRPFGGKVTTAFFCKASGGWNIRVSGPVGGEFYFGPSTKQYREYQLPRVGIWVLGLYGGFGPCFDLDDGDWYWVPNDGYMIMVGTSH